jgi:hypothetical protein
MKSNGGMWVGKGIHVAMINITKSSLIVPFTSEW